MNLGPHAVFIVASYAIVCCVILALIAWVTTDHRRQITTLAELEASGIKRRSVRTSPTP